MKKKGKLLFFIISLLIISTAFAAQSDSQRVNVNVDIIPQVLTPEVNLQPNTIFNIDTPTITGTADPESTVIIYDSNTGQEIGRTVADENGDWSFTFPNLTTGPESFYIVAIDQEGNVSESSQTYTFYYEQTGTLGYFIRYMQASAKNTIQNIAALFTPAVLTTTTTVAAFSRGPITAVATVFIAAPFIAGALGALGFLNILTYILFPINSLLELIGLRKKRPPWGIVYNSATKLPLSQTIVRLFNLATNKLVETRVTDKEGRYGFLVNTSDYVLSATKANYTFPTVIVKDKIDPPYSDIYRGQPLHVQAEKTINVNIPIDPPSKPVEIKNALVRNLLLGISKARIPVLFLGTLFAIWLIITRRELFDYISFGFYSLLWSGEIRLNRIKPWGVAYDSKTKKPLADVVVQIFDQEYNKLLETKTTDKLGRYVFFVKPGNYYLLAGKEAYQFPTKHITKKKDHGYKKLSLGTTFTVTKEKETLINFDIPLDPNS